MLIESARHTRFILLLFSTRTLNDAINHFLTCSHAHTYSYRSMNVCSAACSTSVFFSLTICADADSFFLSNKLKYVVSGNHSPGLAALQFSAVTLWVAPCLFPLLWLFKKKIAGMKNWTFFLSKPRGKLCLFHWMEKLCVTSVFTIWHVLAMWVIILCFWLAHELSDHSGIYHFL